MGKLVVPGIVVCVVTILGIVLCVALPSRKVLVSLGHHLHILLSIVQIGLSGVVLGNLCCAILGNV